MPITPLHFGLLAPVNHFRPTRVAVIPFILVNVWIDSLAILAWLQNLPLPSHDEANHTYLGALVLGTIVAALGVRSWRWVLGAYLGGFSHIFLDSLVHPEMSPLHPVLGNPFYMGWLEPLSWALLPLTAWFIVQSVSCTLDWVRKRQEVVQARTQEPIA